MDASINQPKIAPYGAWKSSISAAAVAYSAIGLDQLQVDGEELYWIESRPLEGGRCVILRRSGTGDIIEGTPPIFNVRSRVHEYGGGAYLADAGTLYFVNFSDQRIYRLDRDGRCRPLTPEGTGMRYADLRMDRKRRLILAVREDHSLAGQEATHSIVALPVNGLHPGRVLVSGHDFYSSPCVSPDGTRMAWIAWKHPNMPWDATELWVGHLNEEGALLESMCLADGSESIQQPRWSPAGELCAITDRTGWWNLYRWQPGRLEPLCTAPFDFGRPPWVFGQPTYDFLSDRQLVCSFIEQGLSCLTILDLAGSGLRRLETEFTEIVSLRAWKGQAVFLGASPLQPVSVAWLDPRTAEAGVFRQSFFANLNPGCVSIPEPLEFPTGNAESAHAFFYLPKNPLCRGPEGESPPLLVKSHGGPTSAASTRLNPGIQYWTSRGFAVLDVNYRGSSGFGRAYRDRLKGNWGVFDVEDCIQGALYLASRGWVDPRRMAISGGSAGGFTTLCALTFHRVFRAGASYYGISDLELLLQDTHKFESRYLESLVGPYPSQCGLYRARSPIHNADGLNCPVILFQGQEDRVVPPAQAEKLAEVLRRKGLPVAYLAFEGEQHGFRRAENIQRCLEAELYFYSRVFSFPLVDDISPVPIDNL